MLDKFAKGLQTTFGRVPLVGYKPRTSKPYLSLVINPVLANLTVVPAPLGGN